MAIKPLDALDMEYQYYSCLVKDIVAILQNRSDQVKVSVWCCKLSEAVYNAEDLREKRNRYLLMLTICMMLNGLRHPFDKYPTNDCLNEISDFHNPKNMIPYHDRFCARVAEDQIKATCDLHRIKCPKDDTNISKVLDKQFEFLINLVGPYVTRLSDPSDRRRGQLWVSFLTSINSKCFHMKGVRNDYTMLLSGYLINDELSGPFLRPPIKKLVPLEYLSKIEDMSNNMIIDPSHPRTIKFFRDVPYPEEGAFAYIAVSWQMSDADAKNKHIPFK